MDVLEEANKPVHQGHTQRTQDGVPVGLHVLGGAPLGVTLAAKIISARRHDVRDEIVISTRCLENRKQKCVTKSSMQEHSRGFGQAVTGRRKWKEKALENESQRVGQNKESSRHKTGSPASPQARTQKFGFGG